MHSYRNTTDATNNGANYVGVTTCVACHTVSSPSIVAKHALHGHSFMLNPVTGASPAYPAQAQRADVPNPPAGKSWSDVSLVVGGYLRKAEFVDLNGYLMTNDAEGVDTQWNLLFPANGVTAGFVPYENSGLFSPLNPKPYDYSCFVCHTTGPRSLQDSGGLHQCNKPGHAGTWKENGIQCEACHGPGSNHVPDPSARDLFVDIDGTKTCHPCHDRSFNAGGNTISAGGGFIQHNQQYPELKASGGMSGFKCTICHDPHAGPNYDRAHAIRNACTVCHSDQDMALHADKTFVNGDYVERLTCESCHMPYASKNTMTASAAFVGTSGARVADMRTHIFRTNTGEVDYTAMFTSDGSEVVKDSAGEAAVTLDFVCLRCHNGVGNAFKLKLSSASDAAPGLHGFP